MRVSEQVSAAERASEASNAEQANEWCERTDERVAQYLHLDSCLFQTTVQQLTMQGPMNYGSEQLVAETSNHTLSHELGSE